MTEGDRSRVGVGQACLTPCQELWPAAKHRPDEALFRQASRGAGGRVTEFPEGQQGRAAPTDSNRGGGRQDFGHYRAAHCYSRT